MRTAIVAAAAALVLAASPASAATLLTSVTDYNAYFFNSYSGTGGDVEGRLAAGGPTSISRYGIASVQGVNLGDTYTLVVGGQLSAGSGRVYQGSTLARTAIVSPSFNTTITYSGGANPTLDFAGEAARLTARSGELAMFTTNGTSTVADRMVTLTGTNSGLNVFSINGADLTNKDSLVLRAPTGSSALVNVTGFGTSLIEQGFTLEGIDRSRVLFNFVDASGVSLQGISFEGSLLAPKATVAFNDGQFNGLLIGQNFLGNGQINYAPYDGGLLTPPTGGVPEPASWAMMIAGVGLTGGMLRRRNSRAQGRRALA